MGFQRPDPRPGFHRRIVLLRLDAALAGEDFDALGLQHLKPLRDEVAAELRPGRIVQGDLLSEVQR